MLFRTGFSPVTSIHLHTCTLDNCELPVALPESWLLGMIIYYDYIYYKIAQGITCAQM